MMRTRAYLAIFIMVPILGVEQHSIRTPLDVNEPIKSQRVARHDLAGSLLEISGLVAFEGGFIAMNDGGPDQHLYVLDTLCNIQRKIFVEARNYDWEALTIGDGKLFIGDVGNNFGARDFLCILSIPLEQLYADTIRKEIIALRHFSYPPAEAKIDPKKHDLDCEAMIYHQGAIHLFSKNRRKPFVQHRVFELNGSNAKVITSEEARIKGQITDACLDLNGDLLLLGYDPPTYASFLIRLKSGSDGMYFQSVGARKRLGSFWRFGQSEAICVAPNGNIWIGSEGSSRLKRSAKLFSIPASKDPTRV